MPKTREVNAMSNLDNHFVSAIRFLALICLMAVMTPLPAKRSVESSSARETGTGTEAGLSTRQF